MPTEESTPGPSRTFLSTYHSSYINLSSGRIYPNVLVEGVKNLVLGGYAGVQNAIDYITFAAPGQGILALDEVSSESPHDRNANAQYVMSSRRDAESMLEQRPHINPQSFLSEANDLGEAGQPATHEDHSSDAVTVARSKHISMWLTVLVVGVLSLVLVPGLAVGIITGQIAWGIALAGATATIVSIFAGLYYHHNK